MAAGKKHLERVIKLQAFARGCAARAKHGRIGKRKKSMRGKAQAMNDLEQKMNFSARSGKFCGGMPRRSSQQQERTIQVKQLAAMPDYLSELTKMVERKLGPF